MGEMELTGIAISLDLATGLSVIGAALTYIWNVNKENQKDREVKAQSALEANQHFEISQVTKVVDSLLVYEMKIVRYKLDLERIAQTGEGAIPDTNDIVGLLIEMMEFIRLDSTVRLKSFPDKVENLNKLAHEIEDWGKTFVAACDKSSGVKMPQMDDLVKIIAERLGSCMPKIREEA